MHELMIDVVGCGAAQSGWAALLGEEGLPFTTHESPEALGATPDLAIFLRDTGLDGTRWAGPAIFDHRAPPGVEPHAAAFSELVVDAAGAAIACPFRGLAVPWSGPAIGAFHLARAHESPRYPLACLCDQQTYVLGDLAEGLISQGYCFRPVCNDGEEEVHQLHPAGRRDLLRRLLREILQQTLRRAGLPAVRLAPRPPGVGRPFLFRVDVDYLVHPQMAPIREQAGRLGWKTSAYVNISGEEQWEDGACPAPPGGQQPLENLRWLRDFADEGHEVASHGVRHELWPSYQKIADDLTRAREQLEELSGQPVVGHASAGGLWHPLAGRAARDVGFGYTTEAALAWGGDPFDPVAGGGAPMQVPCSPIYPAYHALGPQAQGRFVDHFRALAEETAAHDEPLSLMGHPFDLEQAPTELWQQLGAVVDSAGCQPMTLAELHQHTRARRGVRLRLLHQGGAWHAETSVPWELLPIQTGLAAFGETARREASEVLRPARRTDENRQVG